MYTGTRNIVVTARTHLVGSTRTVVFTLVALSVLLLTGCVTVAGDTLPYDEVPQVTVASEAMLVASPSHPASYLSADPIPAGSTVEVLGVDQDAAWLLVLYNDQLGWIPSVFSGTNIASLEPALVFQAPDANCLKFLDFQHNVVEPWISVWDGNISLVGSIYHPQPASEFEDAAMSITIEGKGAVTKSDYLHVPLTENSSLILFTYSLSGIERSDAIRFDLAVPAGAEEVFQVLYFSDSCSENPNLLPVGQLRIPSEDESLNRERDAMAPSAQQADAQDSAVVEVYTGEGGGSFRDEFNGSTLNEGWYWLKENKDAWSLDAVPDHLQIQTDVGDMAQACRNYHNLLLHEAPSGSFALQTMISIPATENFQQAGLLVFDDPDNYVKLDLVWSDSIIKNGDKELIGIELLAEESGKFITWPWPQGTLRQPESGVLLKLSRDGEWFDGWYSVDGQRWIRVGTIHTSAITDPEVGIFALTGVDMDNNCTQTAPTVPASFGYFYLDAESNVVAES